MQPTRFLHFPHRLGCLAFLLATTIGLAQPRIDSLRTEYLDRPLGLDVEIPRFSWQMVAPGAERGHAQQAYQIQVRTPSGEVAWDSGRVGSPGSVLIPYAGSPLEARTRYDWEVTVWDQDGNQHRQASWFETGLLDPDPALARHCRTRVAHRRRIDGQGRPVVNGSKGHTGALHVRCSPASRLT